MGRRKKSPVDLYAEEIDQLVQLLASARGTMAAPEGTPACEECGRPHWDPTQPGAMKLVRYEIDLRKQRLEIETSKERSARDKAAARLRLETRRRKAAESEAATLRQRVDELEAELLRRVEDDG